MRCGLRVLASLFLLGIAMSYCFGCSVLTHEAVIDTSWDVKLKPVLLARYPEATPDELRAAHAFAYGGSIIQDLGYYPHGSKEFSNLTHYVRTGDFVCALLSKSQSLNEFAFALGALSHYVSDTDVHRFATNPGEAMLYPKLKRKFGNIVTYEQDPAAHLKTEFGFDVLEVAKGNFAPQAYHDFIGFQVAKPLVMRVFRDVYGLSITDVFKDFNRSVESYRRAVSKTIPAATRIAWAQRKDDIQASTPGITRDRFTFVMSRSSYERNWGKQYDRPSFGDQVLAILLRLIPPIGPLRTLQFRMPTAPVESLFMRSFNRSVQQYQEKLQNIDDGRLLLENVNYDTGEVSAPGSYRLKDDTYAYWLNKLAQNGLQTVTIEMKANLLQYYHDLKIPLLAKGNCKEQTRLRAEIEQLKSQRVISGGTDN
jgi:Zinc dependent phospholipase C